MKFPFFIAWRYFFTKNKIGYVHLLTLITQIGIAIGTASLVLVLSVFNGFEDLVLSMYNVFDPHIKVVSSNGKNFNGQKVKEILLTYDDIDVYSSTLEEKALVEYNGKQHIVTIKGVDSLYSNLTSLDSVIISGDNINKFKDANVAIVGRGVAYYLSMNIGSVFENLQLYLPKRNANFINYKNAFSTSSLSPVGIFSIQQEIDTKYILTHISYLQNLIQKENFVSAIEINLLDKSEMLIFQKKLAEKIGNNYKVINQFEQQEFLYKILNTEKLVVFLILIFIVLISAFNIISSLTVLIIEKKNDIKTFLNLGLDHLSLKNVFVIKSMLGVVFGSLIGLVLGFLIAYIQQEFGLIKMGEGGFVIDSYPVKILLTDFIFIQLIVLVIGFFASWTTAHLMLKKN
mgnify:FL=1|tara:strand:+ start:7953 stop:9155 length:1203 start_codon:yes stop_codon:yes gene_type:complete